MVWIRDCPARDTSPACADDWDARGELKHDERHALSGSAWSFVRFIFCVFLIWGLEMLRWEAWREDCLGYSVRRGMQNVQNQRLFQNDLDWGIFAINIYSIFYFKMTYNFFIKTEIVQLLPILGSEIWFHDRFNVWKKIQFALFTIFKISPNSPRTQ